MNVREWTLPVYTILMQMAVGVLFLLWVIRLLARSRFKPGEIDRISRNPLTVIIFTVIAAMVASHFHLGRPFYSYLAVLNFKSSWLSREIVFSVLFFWMLVRLLYLNFFENHNRKAITFTGWSAILFGGVLVYCMASIYLLPTQVAWNSPLVIISFFITALMLGGVALACLMILDLKFAEIQKIGDVDLRAQLIKFSLARLTALIIVLVFLSFLVLYMQMRLLSQGDVIARTSLRLLLELYYPLLVLRLSLLIGASLFLIFAVFRMYRLQIMPQKILVSIYLACLSILVGEIVGRFLFYATHIRVGL